MRPETWVTGCVSCERILRAAHWRVPQCELCSEEGRPKRTPLGVIRLCNNIEYDIVKNSAENGKVLSLTLPFDSLDLGTRAKATRYLAKDFREEDNVAFEELWPIDIDCIPKRVLWADRISMIRKRWEIMWEHCPTVFAWLSNSPFKNQRNSTSKWLKVLARRGLPQDSEVDEVISIFAKDPLVTMGYICRVESWLRYTEANERRKSIEAAIIDLRQKSKKNSTHKIASMPGIDLSQRTIARILRKANLL